MKQLPSQETLRGLFSYQDGNLMTISDYAAVAYYRWHSLLETGRFEEFNLMLGMAIKHWYPEEKLGTRDAIGVTMSKTIHRLHYEENES